MTLAKIQARFEAAGNADIAAHSARFFHTGPGKEKTRKDYLEGRI